MRKITIVSVIIVIMGLFLAGCQGQTNLSSEQNTNTQTGVVGQVNFAGTNEMIKFNNTNEFKAFLQQQMLSSQVQSSGNVRTLGKSAMMESFGSAAPTADSSVSNTVASDYSETNVQVAGVDEADFVKNDGRYIYMVSDNKLLIIDAYDAKNAKIVSTTDFNQKDIPVPTNKAMPYYYRYQDQSYAKELFINNDKLVLFVETSEQSFYFQKYDINPVPVYKQKTVVYVYDIKDRTNPDLIETFSSSGAYYSSRMIDEFVYLVTQDYVNDIVHIPMPYVKAETTGKMMNPDIYYFDNPEQSYQLNTITSFDINKNEVVDSKTLTLGYGNTLMVSENNIYIAYQKQRYWGGCFGWRCPVYDSKYEKERFYDVVVPLLEGSLKTDVQAIMNKNLDEDKKWEEISSVLSGFFKTLENDATLEEKYSSMLTKISDAVNEYDAKKELENTKTIIHKLSINDGVIEYQAKGEVYGQLLNQFSLDEYQGNLRLTTNINVWTRSEQVQHNNVYVLNDKMETIGKLTDLAQKERIYSARFIGDRLYLVTFRQVDPFFVIDLSDATKPKVLGELKITGYSDYLHPYDEDHIIAIGKETGESEWGGVTTKGLKIALFDVSDVSKPTLVDKVEIGEQGTDSPALHDHRAFLFSKTTGMLVLPVNEIVERRKLNDYGYSYSYSTWNGAYVFNVSTQGFVTLGKVKHGGTTSNYYNWYDLANVQRSLYMDNNLYTISNKYVKINDLNDKLRELNSIDLPYQGYGYDTPIPVDIGGGIN